jgi:hypothetical protein
MKKADLAFIAIMFVFLCATIEALGVEERSRLDRVERSLGLPPCDTSVPFLPRCTDAAK